MRIRPLQNPWTLSLIITATGLSLATLIWAQAQPAAAPEPKPNQSTDPMLRGFEFRSIGPAVMMGRVDDIQGSEKDTMIVYAGFATGVDAGGVAPPLPPPLKGGGCPTGCQSFLSGVTTAARMFLSA